MEEVLKAILVAVAPSPLALGIVIGLLIAGGGFWAMRRGVQENRKRDAERADTMLVRIDLSDEEKRRQWKAYEHIGHLNGNSFEIVGHLDQLVELNRGILSALNRLADNRWNSGQ